MGGSALSVPTRRLTAAEFHPLAWKLARSLSEHLHGARVEPIPAYRQKPDFGDLDLLVEWNSPIDPSTVPEILVQGAAIGHARQVVASGAIVSFDWRPDDNALEGFQVDLMLTPPECLDASRAYFAYNDLGNLIGRVAHRMGFVHGHQGLLCPVREGEVLLAQVEVTRHPDEILAFLGYDPQRFRAGFETMDDIFAYVASGTHFSPELFSLDDGNHAARTRVRKRPTHRQFQAWLEAHQPASNHAWAPRPDAVAQAAERAPFLARAQALFPEMIQRIQAVHASRALVQDEARQRERLNGRRVSEWTGLTGADLGTFMGSVRERLGSPKDIASWARDRTDEEIKAWVLDQANPRPIRSRRPSP